MLTLGKGTQIRSFYFIAMATTTLPPDLSAAATVTDCLLVLVITDCELFLINNKFATISKNIFQAVKVPYVCVIIRIKIILQQFGSALT